MKWTREQIEALRRNLAIEGRNRFMVKFNQDFGTNYKPMRLEPMPKTQREEKE